ncbi:MAG: hypothetical protein AAFO94_06075 [Bacteroidota bacterium]
MRKIVMLSAFLLSVISASQAQGDIRFGFQLSPSFSWMSTDNNRINSAGTNLGLKLGVLGEFYFRPNYAFIGGLGLTFNQGGTLKHDFGGNFWPDSDLSNPNLNMGDNPLQDGVQLKY